MRRSYLNEIQWKILWCKFSCCFSDVETVFASKEHSSFTLSSDSCPSLFHKWVSVGFTYCCFISFHQKFSLKDFPNSSRCVRSMDFWTRYFVSSLWMCPTHLWIHIHTTLVRIISNSMPMRVNVVHTVMERHNWLSLCSGLFQSRAFLCNFLRLSRKAPRGIILKFINIYV